jgi:hypothetical protein
MELSGLFGESASGPGNVGVAPEPYVFDHDLWVRLRRDQLGVDVIDPLGHQIGAARGINHRWSEDREVVWTPVDGVKHVLVGEFDSFDIYDGDGDERDWEYRIFPDPPFRLILDWVVARMSADEREDLVPRDRGEGFCVECEITPDEDFRPLPSPRQGQKLGVYGPWVRDFGHSGRPEIHPCEVLWWMGETRPGVATSRLVAVVQDDSDRLDWPGDFDGPIPRPWSAFPRRANITFALRPVVQQHMQFNLRILDDREMAVIVTGAVPGMTGEFGGQPVITVTKLVDDPGKISMGLSPIAPDPDNVHLRCFLTVGVQVSDANRGRAGHALLNLETLELGGRLPRDPRTPDGGQRA